MRIVWEAATFRAFMRVQNVSFGSVTRTVLDLRIPIVFLWAVSFFFSCLPASAQTATISALNGESCAGTRFGSDLNCTANDFATNLTFAQPAASALANCRAGETIMLDIIADIQGGNPSRYDGAFFFGQSANNPQLNNAANSCSIGTFPTTPLPFRDSDGDTCGDYQNGGQFSQLRINSISVVCEPAPGTNLLGLPYTLVYDQNTGSVCSPATVTAPGKSKCTANVLATVTGLTVRGYVTINKETVPDGSSQSFDFTTATSPAATVTPSTATITDGNSQTFEVPLDSAGGTQQITITESLASAWEPTATIVCTTPSGGSAASYVTVNNTTRQITATLDATNYSAVCTITNTKQTRVRTVKALNPTTDSGLFNLTAGGTTVNDQGNGGTTGYVAVTAGASQTFSETAGTGTSLGDYRSTYVCTNDLTAATVASGSGSSVSFTPPSQSDTTCTFTNERRNPQFSLSKSVDQTSISAPVTLSYTITITNTGNVPLSGVSVTDTLAQGAASTNLTLTGPQTDTGIVGEIDVGESWVYTASHTVSQSELDNGSDLVNTVSVLTAETGAPPSNASVTTTITQSSSLDIAKSSAFIVDANSDNIADAGDVIRYSYVVTNDGNTTITDVEVNDSHNGTGTFPANPDHSSLTDNAPTGDSPDSNASATIWGTLAPGDLVTFTVDYTVTQTDVDTLQ